MSNSINIKPENWSVLADTINDVIVIPGSRDLTCRIVQTFRDGRPPSDYIQLVVAVIAKIQRATYNGSEREKASSLLETLHNYKLI
jgi:hypothetical protein